MSMSFYNRIALVSGGATGIGKAISTALAKTGVKVYVLDVRPDTEQICREFGCIGLLCNILEAGEVQSAIDSILFQEQKLDILVNNAGIVRLAPVDELSEEDWDATMNINLKAHFQVCKKVIPHMKQRNYGRIISMSSQASIIGLEGHIAYCASKAAIDAMTRVFAVELGPYQITANSIAPTVIMTELGKKAWAGEKGERMKEKIPVRHFGEPDDVARAVLFLASDDALLVNGHTLVLDGGYSIQ